MFENKTVLLTGGTGSFGTKFTEILLSKYKPRSLRIFSRDELKQWEMDKQFSSHPRLRFFVGDIRDRHRLNRAIDGVDIIVHAAALKQVPSCEYNPFEAVKTNILGAQNIIDAAIDHNVEKVIALSTDKAVNPVNLYGATKMCMEKLFIAANAYVGEKRKTRMSCVRYGNVIGSRGSIIPLLIEQRKTGTVTITDPRMTRFFLTLEQGVEFVLNCSKTMEGGEVFVPKIPSMRIADLIKALAPQCRIKNMGIRPGEKIHECLLTQDEARHALEYPKHFVIQPEHSWWTQEHRSKSKKSKPIGKPTKNDFYYSSDKNSSWLTIDQLRRWTKQ